MSFNLVLPAARRFALQHLTTRHGLTYWEVGAPNECVYAKGDHFNTSRNILNLSPGTYETEINISRKWIL